MHTLNKQNGMSLVVSLVILSIITLATISALQRSNMQTKIIGNLQHKQLLFTAGQNEISFMMDKLKDEATQQEILSLFDANSPGKNDQLLFISNELKGHFSVKNEIRKVALPSAKSSLKNIEGSSNGTPALRPYYLASKITVKEKHYNQQSNTGIKDVQEVGFYYLIPTALDTH